MYEFPFIIWKVDDTEKLMCHVSHGLVAIFLFFFLMKSTERNFLFKFASD